MSAIREVFGSENVLTYGGDEDSAAQGIIAERTDPQLVELTIAGDPAAFEQLFDRYKRTAARAASRYFDRPEDIEEIVQSVFVKAYFELHSFRGEHELSLASWISRITANQCLDHLRSRKRKPESLECELSEADAAMLVRHADKKAKDSEQDTISKDLAEKLLSKVSAEDRAVLIMQYVEGAGVAEIGEALGWSVSKVKIRAWRARNVLRRILKKYT